MKRKDRREVYSVWKIAYRSFKKIGKLMPTVMRIGPYRFYFYSNENDEPRHIHIKAAENEAKFWLEPIELVWNEGFNTRQLKQIERHLEDNLAYIIEVWDGFFGV